MTRIDRWWRNVSISEGCWLWTGSKNGDGYGAIGRDPQVLAHRLAWILFCGQIPRRKLVLHRCDTPACVRPDHLFLGTQKDNVRDCIEKGRRAVTAGEQNGGHRLTVPQVEAVRAARAAGVSAKALAAEHGITDREIYHIAAGTRWRQGAA